MDAAAVSGIESGHEVSTLEGTVMVANEFFRNGQGHSSEELTPYEGQFVAWSEDRQHILAHGATLEDLIEEIEREGIQHYVVDSVLVPEEVFLGGADL